MIAIIPIVLAHFIVSSERRFAVSALYYAVAVEGVRLLVAYINHGNLVPDWPALGMNVLIQFVVALPYFYLLAKFRPQLVVYLIVLILFPFAMAWLTGLITTLDLNALEQSIGQYVRLI